MPCANTPLKSFWCSHSWIFFPPHHIVVGGNVCGTQDIAARGLIQVFGPAYRAALLKWSCGWDNGSLGKTSWLFPPISSFCCHISTAAHLEAHMPYCIWRKRRKVWKGFGRLYFTFQPSMLFQSYPKQWHGALVLLLTEKFTAGAGQEAASRKEQSHSHPAGAEVRATLLQDFLALLIETRRKLFSGATWSPANWHLVDEVINSNNIIILQPGCYLEWEGRISSFPLETAC